MFKLTENERELFKKICKGINLARTEWIWSDNEINILGSGKGFPILGYSHHLIGSSDEINPKITSKDLDVSYVYCNKKERPEAISAVVAQKLDYENNVTIIGLDETEFYRTDGVFIQKLLTEKYNIKYDGLMTVKTSNKISADILGRGLRGDQGTKIVITTKNQATVIINALRPAVDRAKVDIFYIECKKQSIVISNIKTREMREVESDLINNKSIHKRFTGTKTDTVALLAKFESIFDIEVYGTKNNLELISYKQNLMSVLLSNKSIDNNIATTFTLKKGKLLLSIKPVGEDKYSLLIDHTPIEIKDNKEETSLSESLMEEYEELTILDKSNYEGRERLLRMIKIAKEIE